MEKLVGEDVLADGDEEGAAEGLREHHDGCADGDIVLGQRGLDGNKRLLHAEADTCTEDKLVADPLGRVGVSLEGGQEAGANGHEDRRQQHEWRVVADGGDGCTSNHGDDDEAENSGQVHDTGLCGTDAFDGLEPDGDVVDHDEESSTQHGNEPGGAPDIAVLENARRDSSILLFPDLDRDEANEKQTGNDEQGDDAAVLPLVFAATPLQSKEQADDSREEQGSTFEIELFDLLDPGSVDLGCLTLDLEERDDEGSGDGADRQVDVEAPSPGKMVSEGTAEAKHC